MKLTQALLNALRANASREIRAIELASENSILLTHASGEQLLINTLALAPHIMGDTDRLVTEAKGALAALERAASRRQGPGDEDALAHLVPVIRPLEWLAKANTQMGRDMLADGLATQLSTALFVTFALEYHDRRVPVLDWPSMDITRRNVLLDLALANQKRIIENEPEALIATDLGMGDGTFFLQSKHVQAASLMLQPTIWNLIQRFTPQPPETTLAAIVGQDVVAFGPANIGDLESHADLLRSVVRGLRKSLGGDGNWRDDVFILSDGLRLPQELLPEFGPEHS